MFASGGKPEMVWRTEGVRRDQFRVPLTSDRNASCRTYMYLG